jgi:hypothetical protein
MAADDDEAAADVVDNVVPPPPPPPPQEMIVPEASAARHNKLNTFINLLLLFMINYLLCYVLSITRIIAKVLENGKVLFTADTGINHVAECFITIEMLWIFCRCHNFLQKAAY